MTPNTYMCRMSSRDFFRNPASAKKEAETAPVIINEYGTAAFVFLPFVQYEALLQKQKPEANKNDSISAAEGKKSEENPEIKIYLIILSLRNYLTGCHTGWKVCNRKSLY